MLLRFYLVLLLRRSFNSSNHDNELFQTPSRYLRNHRLRFTNPGLQSSIRLQL